MEITFDYFALVNEVNKSKTLFEILNILQNDYSQKKNIFNKIRTFYRSFEYSYKI